MEYYYYGLEDENQFTLKFHLIDGHAEDKLGFGDLSNLDASPLEHFNYTVYKLIQMMSLRMISLMEEAIKAMNMFSAAGGDAVTNIPRTCRA